MPEITRGCVDMTNTSSTYLSIVLGAIVGGLITYWVYKIQKKTTAKQDETLRRINDLEVSHDKALKLRGWLHERVLEGNTFILALQVCLYPLILVLMELV